MLRFQNATQKSKTALGLLLCCLFLAISCGRKGSQAASGSIDPGPGETNNNTAAKVIPFATCDLSAVAVYRLCIENVGSDYNDAMYISNTMTYCQGTLGGTFSTNNCERTGSIGTCKIGSGQTNETHTTYYPPLYNTSTAATACTNTSGTFTAI